MFKIKDICLLEEFDRPYIYKIPMPFTCGQTRYYDTLSTDKAELIMTKPCLNFKDLIQMNKKYRFKHANNN